MTDHYELFGVGRDASKDEIKAAYRAEVESAEPSTRAELNRAWNVLSDPIQRQRYDEQLAAGGDGEDSGDTEASVVVPASRATGARRGPQNKSVDTNGSSSNGSSNGAGSRGADDGEPPRRGQTALETPTGLVMATPRARSYALAFDFAVLVVIFLVVQFAGVAVIKNQYPKESDRIDAVSKQADRADKAKSKADDAKDKANDALSDAKKKHDSAAIQDAQEKADDAKAKATAADKHATKVEDDLTKAQDKLRTAYLLVYGVVFLLALLYTVPMSARTGQTPGKRLRKVRLVRVDGSAPGWSTSLLHYGVPIFITLALINILGPLALIIGLGCVLWNLRDRNRQGVHDKLAKTFVVEA